MRVTVIGAGVAGLTSALALAERGCAVEVVERGPALGAESCSRCAGGMLAPWCERESAEELVVELGREALEYWPTIHAGTVRKGSLVLAQRRDEPDLERFARRTRNYRRLDAAAIAALEPDLAGRFAHGLFFRRRGSSRPACRPGLAGRAPGGAGRADPLRRRCRGGCPAPSSTAGASPPATG